MKPDSLLIITVASIMLILCSVIYMQHVELTSMIQTINHRSEWAQAMDAIAQPIDHIYIETADIDKGMRQ